MQLGKRNHLAPKVGGSSKGADVDLVIRRVEEPRRRARSMAGRRGRNDSTSGRLRVCRLDANTGETSENQRCRDCEVSRLHGEASFLRRSKGFRSSAAFAIALLDSHGCMLIATRFSTSTYKGRHMHAVKKGDGLEDSRTAEHLQGPRHPRRAPVLPPEKLGPAARPGADGQGHRVRHREGPRRHRCDGSRAAERAGSGESRWLRAGRFLKWEAAAPSLRVERKGLSRAISAETPPRVPPGHLRRPAAPARDRLEIDVPGPFKSREEVLAYVLAKAGPRRSTRIPPAVALEINRQAHRRAKAEYQRAKRELTSAYRELHGASNEAKKTEAGRSPAIP